MGGGMGNAFGGPGGCGGCGANMKDQAQMLSDDAAERQAILEEKRTASREEVDDFIRNNRLDDSAGAIFKKEPADIQANVIDRGSLAECKNPSAALMGRLRDARQNRYKPIGGARGTGEAPTLTTGIAAGGIAKDVEDFINTNKIDMGAARALRAEPPEVQQGVMDRGTLDGFQNPSALVMARIKDVKLVRKEAAHRNIEPGSGGSGGSSGQLTRELTREELRKAVEARKAGKGGTTSASLLAPHKRGRSRSDNRRRGRSRSGSRRRRSRSRSRSRGDRRR